MILLSLVACGGEEEIKPTPEVVIKEIVVTATPTPVPTKNPTPKPILSPTKTPTPTLTSTLTPTATPNIAATVEAQLKYAKIDGFFDAIYSVDVVGKFKPHKNSYQKVLSDHQLTASEVLMVAAHGWDIAGAQNAGLKTAFISRPGKSTYPLAKRPDHIAEDLENLTNILI